VQAITHTSVLLLVPTPEDMPRRFSFTLLEIFTHGIKTPVPL
jgi:hypothetical protein